MNVIKTFFKINLKLALLTFSLLKPLLNYLERETARTWRNTTSPSGTVPIDKDMLNAAAAERDEARRKMLDTERQAQIAAERAKQTQHHQDQMRAAQARADADRARRQY